MAGRKKKVARKSAKHHQHQHQSQKVEIHISDHHRKKKPAKRGRGGGGGGGGVRQMQGYANINLPPTYVNYNFPPESNFGSRNQSAPTPGLVSKPKPVDTLNPVPIMNNSELQPAGRPLTDAAVWRESRIKYFDEPKPQPEKMKLPESHPVETPIPNIFVPEGKYTPIYESLPNHSTGREFEKPSASQFFGLEKTKEPEPLSKSVEPVAFKSEDFFKSSPSDFIVSQTEKKERRMMGREDIESSMNDIQLGLASFNKRPSNVPAILAEEPKRVSSVKKMVYAIESKKQGRENEMMRGQDVDVAPKRVSSVKKMAYAIESKKQGRENEMMRGQDVDVAPKNEPMAAARISAEELRKERNREYQRRRRARIRMGEPTLKMREPKSKKSKHSEEKDK